MCGGGVVYVVRFYFGITQKNTGLEEQLKALQKETQDLVRMKEVRVYRMQDVCVCVGGVGCCVF